MEAEELQALRRRAAKAFADRQPWETLWEDVYRYVFPDRASFHRNEPHQDAYSYLFNDTAVEAAQDFSAMLSWGLIPNYSKWFSLDPSVRIPAGRQRDQIKAELDYVRDLTLEIINQCNVPTAISESFLDIALGWSVLIPEANPVNEALRPIRCVAVPHPQIAMTVNGVGDVTALYRRRKMSREEVARDFPESGIEVGTEARMNDEVEVTSCYELLNEPGVETWRTTVVVAIDSHSSQTVYENEESGSWSCPFVVMRWSRFPGTTYPRGVAMMKMPTIRKLNLIDQYTLDNAELAIAGLWQTDDNSVINADSVEIVPGTLISVDRNSRGLMPLQPGSNLEFGHVAIQDYEREIRQAFFSMDLGPTNKTPMSATEVAERQSQLARRIGAPFTRLMQGGLMPLVHRILRILTDSSKIELPKYEKRELTVQSHSPLAAAQKQENARQLMDWKGAVDYLAGPLAPAYINLPPVLTGVTKEFEVPANSLRSEEDAERLVRGIYEQFTAGGQGPADEGAG